MFLKLDIFAYLKQLSNLLTQKTLKPVLPLGVFEEKKSKSNVREEKSVCRVAGKVRGNGTEA